MKSEYAHENLNEEIRSISGYYILESEMLLNHNGREVLYIVGYGIVDNSCCGVGGCRYALVPGYILEWKNKKNENGDAVSEVEPVSDKESQSDIQKVIMEDATITQVIFS